MINLYWNIVKSEALSEPQGPLSSADLHFLSYQLDTSLHCKTLDMGAAALHLPVHVPAFAGTHCANPRRDGQAEFTSVAGYVPLLSGRAYVRLSLPVMFIVESQLTCF